MYILEIKHFKQSFHLTIFIKSPQTMSFDHVYKFPQNMRVPLNIYGMLVFHRKQFFFTKTYIGRYSSKVQKLRLPYAQIWKKMDLF